MNILSITVPKAFKEGPQFDEDGDLIPGSWPMPFPTEGLVAWIPHGIEKSNRILVDVMVDDSAIASWLNDLPPGWLNSGHHSWDLVSKPIYNEDGLLVTPSLTTHIATDTLEYTKHIDPPRDENGVLTGTPAEYRRQHTFFGWEIPLD